MVNPLQTYQRNCFSRVLTCAGRLSVNMNAETLHELRVELKRIRFVKNVLREFVNEKKAEKAYLPFKKLFKQLGEIRGQHVNIYRLSTTLGSGEANAAHQKFEKEQQKLEQKFQRGSSKKIMNLQTGMQAMNTLVLALPTWDDERFIRQLKKRLMKRFHKRTSERKLHASRHLLKSVIYSAEVSPSMDEKAKRVFNMDAVTKLEDAIGDWHDLSLLLNGKSAQLFNSKTKKKIERKIDGELNLIRQLIPNLFLP